MMVMGMFFEHGGDVVDRNVAWHKRRKDFSRFGWVFRSPLLGINNRLRDGFCHRRIITHQRTAKAQHAAGHRTVFTVHVVIDFLKVVAVFNQPSLWVIAGNRLHFSLAQGLAKQIGGILHPVDLFVRIDALFSQLNSKEVAQWTGLIADRHVFPHQVADVVNSRVLRHQQSHTATVRAHRQVDVKALFQRFKPA